MALARVRRTRIDQLAEEGHKLAKKVQLYLDDPDTFISGSQLGITLAMLFIGAAGEKAFAENLSNWIATVGESMVWHPDAILTAKITIYVVVFTLTAFIQTVFGELLPKSLTFHRAELVILYTVYPMHYWCLVTKPLLLIMSKSVELILKLFNVPDPPSHHMVYSEEELRMLVSASHEVGVIEENEEEMLHSVFEFADTVVSEIMTPRRDMICLSADRSVRELVDLALKHGHSRIPIFEEDIDSIFGLVHIRDGLRAFVEHKETLQVRELARQILIVPENKGLGDLLAEFKKTKTHMAIVVDEHGGTQGMVTFEDLLEELVGEIADEHDVVEEMIQPAADGSMLIDARIALEDVTDKLGIEIDDEQFNTLGGHVFGLLGREPSEGDEVVSGQYKLQIVEADRHRIIKLRLIHMPPAVEEDPAAEKNGTGEGTGDTTGKGHDSVSSVEASH